MFRPIKKIKPNTMTKQLIPFLLLLLAFGCKESPKNEQVKETKTDTPETSTTEENKYPASLKLVFDAHGGHENWKKYTTLSYDIDKGNSKEVHVIDLYKRRDRITMDGIEMGFDGNQVWIQDTSKSYRGDPVFYHNLMFYFYAMPFVLGDSGIQYGDTESLEFDGKSYPGISITYNAGVGTSPKDEYYIHYDPETFQMAWLGYTVTYRTGEDSDNIKWIRYDDWQKVEDLLLPKSISWYDYEGRVIGDRNNTVNFENVELSKESKHKQFYEKPEGAIFVEGRWQT